MSTSPVPLGVIAMLPSVSVLLIVLPFILMLSTLTLVAGVVAPIVTASIAPPLISAVSMIVVPVRFAFAELALVAEATAIALNSASSSAPLIILLELPEASVSLFAKSVALA